MTDISTRELVQSTAIELMADGKTPTPKAIRDVIGKGSNTTIAEELSKFFAESAMLLNPAHEIPMEVSRHLTDFWKLAISMAAQHHAKEVTAFSEYKASAEESLARVKALNLEKSDLLDDLTAKYDSQSRGMLDLNKTLSANNDKIIEVERECTAAKQDALMVREALNELKTIHGQLVETHETMRTRLEADCAAVKSALKEAEFLGTFNQQQHKAAIAELEAKHDQEIIRLNATQTDLQASLDVSTTQHASLNTALNDLKIVCSNENKGRLSEIESHGVTKALLLESKESSKTLQERLDRQQLESQKVKNDYHIALGKTQALQEQLKEWQSKVDLLQKSDTRIA